MKIYVRSDYRNMNSSTQIDTVKIIVNVIISRSDTVAANDKITVRPSPDVPFIDEGTGQLVLSLYNAFISTVKEVAYEEFGITCIGDEQSTFNSPTYGLSNSRYLDFLLNETANSNSVRFIFFLRVSDHDGNRADQARHAQVRLNNYNTNGVELDGEIVRISRRNSIGGTANAWYGRIEVGSVNCRTFGDAVHEAIILLGQYKQLEKTPYIWDNVEAYIRKIKDDVESADGVGIWKVTDSLGDKDLWDFSLYFCKVVGGRPRDMFAIRFQYSVENQYGIMKVTLKKNAGGSEKLYEIKYTNYDTRKTIFDQSKLDKLFKNEILPRMKKYNRPEDTL